MEFLKSKAKEFGINLNAYQLKEFEIYMNYLLEYNLHTNLTSIKDPDDVMIKHFIDSISILKFMKIKENSKIIDVGTGAGFPGVPIKIYDDSVNLTLLDSLGKRITFLKNLAEKLEIDIEAIHARAEELGNNKSYREKFDLAVSRAVAPLNILLEYCLPFVKVGGSFIALKGPDVNEEIENAKNALSFLGGAIEAKFTFDLPLEKGKRSLIVIKKVKSCEKKYPRKNSKISSMPL